MNDRELTEAGEEFRSAGALTPPLLSDLTRVADTVTRHGRLPASLSPYGSWDAEATSEVLQSWLEGKLLRGDLLALLDRARTAAAFRRMAERSLRHWLLNQRRRSQAQNLYVRMAALMREDDEFMVRQDAARPQDVWWTTAQQPEAPVRALDNRALAAAAWSVGDLEPVRYSSERARTSPLLSSADIKRFIIGMLGSTSTALTLTLLMSALGQRFDLGEIEFADPEAAAELPSPHSTADEVALRLAADAVIVELTSRQTDVLKGRRANETLESLAARHGCSVGTIHNEERRIRQLLERFSGDAEEARRLLKNVGDALYEGGS